MTGFVRRLFRRKPPMLDNITMTEAIYTQPWPDKNITTVAGSFTTYYTIRPRKKGK